MNDYTAIYLLIMSLICCGYALRIIYQIEETILDQLTKGEKQ